MTSFVLSSGGPARGPGPAHQIPQRRVDAGAAQPEKLPSVVAWSMAIRLPGSLQLLVDGIPPVAGRPGCPASPTDPASRLPQGITEHPGPGQAPLRGGADLRPAPPLQAARRPMGTPHRTSRRLRLAGLRPDLLETPQEGRIMIVLRALSGTASSAGGRLGTAPNSKPPGTT